MAHAYSGWGNSSTRLLSFFFGRAHLGASRDKFRSGAWSGKSRKHVTPRPRPYQTASKKTTQGCASRKSIGREPPISLYFPPEELSTAASAAASCFLRLSTAAFTLAIACGVGLSRKLSLRSRAGKGTEPPDAPGGAAAPPSFSLLSAGLSVLEYRRVAGGPLETGGLSVGVSSFGTYLYPLDRPPAAAGAAVILESALVAS